MESTTMNLTGYDRLGLNRRNFIANAGKGIITAGIIGDLTLGSATASAQQTRIMAAGDFVEPKPIKLTPLDDASEIEPAESPAPANPDKRLGFALVGLGHLTIEQIMPAFGSSKYCKPTALVSGDPVKAAQLAEQYGIPKTGIYSYKNFDDIKNNPDVDIVFIVLPNSMHEEFTIRSAKAGKHVLCEKPMTTSSASAQRMIDACKKADVKLMVAYRIQYEPNNTQMKNWVRSKEYGKVKLIDMHNSQNIGDPKQWRLNMALAGGGSLPDIGLYCLNTARFLTGEEPEWLLASTYSTPGDERFKEVEETVLFQMRFPSGTLVNAATSYGIHQSRRYRCFADNGAWFGMDPAFSYKGLKNEVSQAKGKIEWKSNPEIGQKDHFATEMDHMALCVLKNVQPYTPGEEGLQDQKLMEAIYKSAKEGKAIRLDKITTIDTFRGSVPEKA